MECGGSENPSDCFVAQWICWKLFPLFQPFLMAFPSARVGLARGSVAGAGRLGLDSARGTFLPSQGAAQVPGLYSRLLGSRTASPRHPDCSKPGLLQEHRH